MKPLRFLTVIAVALVGIAVAQSCGGSPGPSPLPPVNPMPTPPSTGLSCGVERWSVKTLSDADATRVNLTTVVPTTITALNNFAVHCAGLPETRTFVEEFQVYEVTGVVQIARNEDDRDVHIALRDPTNLAQTIVVEVVDPACSGAAQSPFVLMLTQARTQYESLGPLQGKTFRVRGVGFYDFAHNQTGRSRSCLELHPVLSISPRQ